ncbi:WxL domain-containing protein [Evansella sp. AB-P1]|uniref:WxL domain-containing protein n=1 Tax=Evansella sp. AB-P1 TaxID=3037653 RepID=UPI00241EB953|nr:WxL domain-containing protein [Evansella sp. AB-P1]MDG5789621.1 WxL domain-containing protein [Evansella sp. AB-P1]
MEVLPLLALYRNLTRKYLVPVLSTFLLIILLMNITTVKSSETSVNFSVSSGTLNVHSSKKNVILRMDEEKNIAYGDAGALTIVDATGSGSGWNLTLKSTPIKKLKQNESSIDEDVKGYLLLQTQEANIQEGEGSSNVPDWVGNRTYQIDENFPTKVLSANRGEGMGTYYIDFGVDSLKFQLPQGMTTNKYNETTLIWNIVSGP